MKKLSTYLFLLLFSFHTVSWADDITDFQIEGMSVGDSALDYFSKKELNDLMQFGFETEEYAYVNISKEKLDIFDNGLILFKPKDIKFTIHSISGRIHFHKDISACHKKKNEIVNELSQLFKNVSEKQDEGTFNYSGDKSNKSKVTAINFSLYDGGVAHVGCYNFTKEFLEKNNYEPVQVVLSMSVGSAEYNDFQTNRAFE